jgi:uncharacterized membrane protein
MPSDQSVEPVDQTAPAGPTDPAAPSAVAPPAAAPPAADRPPRRGAWFRYTLPGAWTALIFAGLSFSPSLVPRPGLLQGVVCGISAAIGYGLGVVGASVWRAFPDRPARPPRRWSWPVFYAVGAVLLLVCWLLGQRWQGQLRDMMSAPAESWWSKLLLPVSAALVFVLLVAIGRGLRGAYRWLWGLLSRWIGRRAARAIGWVAVTGLSVLLVSGLLQDVLLQGLDNSFSVADRGTADGAEQPTTALRSGGPDSLVAWDTLGLQGRNYTGTGPTQQQIAAFWGGPALEPIRAYAGIQSAPNVEERAQLAVQDLERAGGFDREYLVVAGTTGTGWIDPASIDALEYEVRGDVASVGIQYSYLPSWLSFMVDQVRAREAGRAMFDAVYQRWIALPVDDRPKLLVFGVSLGSFSGEAAFSGEADLANRTDGVLFVGPPNFNALRQEFEAGRDPGSTAAEPVFRDGRTVRFTPDPSQPTRPTDAPWDGTRVLYVMHGSDPVVWWSPSLLLTRPDWLDEPAGTDQLEGMFWVPFVTFWQVTVDMMELVDVPSGHGHDYTVNYLDAWAQVVQPAGWTPEKAEQLRAIILAEDDAG